MTPSRIYVALDFPDAAAALALATRLDPAQCGVKVGKELFTAAGPDLVRTLVARGFRTVMQGVATHRPNAPLTSYADAFVLDDWR